MNILTMILIILAIAVVAKWGMCGLLALLVPFAILSFLCWRYGKKQKILLEEQKKALPFTKTLKVGDEIYPGVCIGTIRLNGTPDVMIKGLEEFGRLAGEKYKFRYADSPWTTEIVSIDVVNQTVSIRCY